MFKKHPITTILNFFLYSISICYLKNSIFIFILLLGILFANHYTFHKKYYHFLQGVAILSVIDIIFGNITGLLQLLLFIIYIIEVTRDYTKIDMIYVYDTLFPSSNKVLTLSFIKYVYYKDIFRKNYKLLSQFEKELGYKSKWTYRLYSLKQCMIQSKKEIDYIIRAYEKSLYLNKRRNKYKICFSKEDFFLILGHLFLFILVYFLGRSSYAIFH